MKTALPITIENTNVEVLARIVKATANKYNYPVNIDFSNGNRKIEFNFEEKELDAVLTEVKDMLYNKKSLN